MREIGSNPETVIDFIGSLAKVAVMKAEGDAAPVYQSPAQACAELRSLVRDQGHWVRRCGGVALTGRLMNSVDVARSEL